MPLNPNIRLVQNDDSAKVEESDLEPKTVQIPDPTPKDNEILDDSGNVIKIEHADGSVTVSIGGRPLKSAQRAKSEGWYKNLCDDIAPEELTRIAEELLTGIRDDELSRGDWTSTVAEGIKLLGIKLEPNSGSGVSGDAAPVEGMSKVRHPLLLEAVLRFQANARGEFLPVDGPVKMRDDSNNATSDEDQLANFFQKDFNHFLTVVAEEYYPDTDRMFLKLGFQGLTFKKVYYCPLRNRPSSETVEAKDLIVNEEAKTLQSAARITHRIMMKPSTFRRMQLLGVYRDIDLGVPVTPTLNPIEQAEKETQGVKQTGLRQQDRDREIFECYCELNIRDFEHKWRGKDSGLDVPYRVTIDVSSRTILSVCRDYKKSDKLPERRKTFVPYLFVPGFGFYGLGLLHILGNPTNALTAAWREMLDNGMFANFPGWIYSKPAGRQATLNFRVPPGGGVPFDTQGGDIRTSIMALPYNTQHMAPLMQLTDSIAQAGMRLGGAAEQPVEEGRGVQPVGTTLALIEQAQKILSSVHKRVHSAQQLEFMLILDVFRDYPDSFWECNDAPSYQWDQETFERALSNCNFVPVADPNTSSQTQRIMKVVGLKEAQGAAPDQYDGRAVEELVVQTLGFTNWERLLKPISQVGQPPPEMLKEKAELDIKKQDADTRAKKVMIDGQVAQQKGGLDQAALQLDAKNSETEQGLGAIKAKADLGMHAAELKSKADDRLMELRKQVIDIAQNVAVHPESAELVNPVVQEAFQDLKHREHAQGQASPVGASFGDIGGMTK